ncbi:internalin-A [Kordia sp. SMS9]|uniref:hypothetical protein n=1 Tax=Kordia sp. SMS9 TaxID=2282170 RepID=UPI000E10AC16|nr:hypothetical protein [Kordia sp. SMS9]AXG70629.1 internalin-A [Kordia sp. SMS9]
MKKLTKLIIALGCVICFQNCENDDFDGGITVDPETEAENLRDQQFKDENFGNTTTGNFIGIITDETGNNLENVLVTIGSVTTMTDRNGFFILNDVQVFENFAYIKARKDGYLNGSRMVIPKTNGTNRINIVLLEKEVTQTITSGVVSEVTSGAVKVTFSGDFITQDGNSYSGPVDVVLDYIRPNTLQTFTEAPGSLFAQTSSNEARGLETYGMVGVNLFSPSGEILNINPESPATITFPLFSSQTSTAPETIQLWYFDEEQGYWKEEGVATRDGNNYVGEVSHFTWWNCDIPFDSVQLCVTLTPTNSIEPAPYFMSIKRVQTDEFIFYGPLTSYQAECGLIPRNEEVSVAVYGGVDSQSCNATLIYEEILGGYNADATATISFQEQFTITPITGMATNCNGDPITNGYIYINNVNTFNITDGIINVGVQTCATTTETFAVQLYDFESNQWTIVNDVTMDGNPVNIGNLSTCENTGGIYNGNISLVSQSELNAFGALNYSTINGNLQIGQYEANSNISDLTPLMSLTNVNGSLRITDNAMLSSLNGLENLVSTQVLTIQSNTSLQSITGLSNITDANAMISINYNNSLTSLDGLEGITSTGTLRILNNNALTSIDALQSLNSVGRLYIHSNPLLSSIAALSNISTSTTIEIVNLPLLTSLQGLEQLTSVSLLRISYNNGLTDLAELSNLTTAESLSIGGNDSLTSLNGLENVTTCNWMLIGQDIDFDVINDAGNNNLNDFCALQNLFTNGTFIDPPTSIFNGVYIINNPFNPSIQDIIDGNCSQ